MCTGTPAFMLHAVELVLCRQAPGAPVSTPGWTRVAAALCRSRGSQPVGAAHSTGQAQSYLTNFAKVYGPAMPAQPIPPPVDDNVTAQAVCHVCRYVPASREACPSTHCLKAELGSLCVYNIISD